MKEQQNLRPADVGRIVVLTAGMLLIKLTFSHIDYIRTRTLQLCFFFFTEQNSNSVSFSPSQC